MILKPLSHIFDRIWAQKFEFFAVFFVVLLSTYLVLVLVDFIPEKPEEIEVTPVEEVQTVDAGPSLFSEIFSGIAGGFSRIMAIGKRDDVLEGEDVVPLEEESETDESSDEPAAISETVDPYPVRLVIEKLDKDVTILNPESRDVAALDAALLEGVVHHPDSADFENEGTIFLFGHSSYLPVVRNKNFQAFNGIQNLEWGDEVVLQSGDTEYVYRVLKVYKAEASEAEVTLDHSREKLVLMTCNSFGSKDDRFVVEAELKESRKL